MCTEEAFRGRKVGTHLMRLFLNHCLDKEVRLQVYSENKAGIVLYEKFGFKSLGITSLIASDIIS
jgi:ribosomal protein S18 acetylase RimI-like enzyme